MFRDVGVHASTPRYFNLLDGVFHTVSSCFSKETHPPQQQRNPHFRLRGDGWKIVCFNACRKLLSWSFWHNRLRLSKGMRRSFQILSCSRIVRIHGVMFIPSRALSEKQLRSVFRFNHERLAILKVRKLHIAATARAAKPLCHGTNSFCVGFAFLLISSLHASIAAWNAPASASLPHVLICSMQ
jgi:hypothetical protein